MVIKKCIICGKEFNAKGRALCCSKKCSKENELRKRKKRREKNHVPKIKICKICGTEFEAKGNDKCCSSECSKKNKQKNFKEWCENNRNYYIELKKEYRKKHKDEISEYNKKWYNNHREERIEYNKEYRENHKDEISEYKKEYNQKKISELNQKYDGDLNLILKSCPNSWMEREAKMQVWFNESYCEGMIAKINSTPVCEVTGKKDDLVIHHLYSFNTHPELGNDPANMVRIATSVHDKFHNIYGKGNNTPEQWIEFVEGKL